MKLSVLILFWVTSWVALFSIFAGPGEWAEIDFIYTTIFFVTLLIPASLNDWYLRPRLLNNERYWLYFASLIAAILAGAFINQELFDRFIDVVLPGYYFISYYEYFDIVKFFAAFVGLATLLGFSIERFQLQKAKADAELKALTSQVNPHFLFNSLTVLYGLSVQQSKDTSPAILKLSDILRYVIYQSSQSTVTIGSEARLIRDYFDLQRYRVHPTTRIDFKEDIHNEATAVCPMLFLPLIENSFKHGVHGATSQAFVTVRLQEAAGVVKFTIANNKPEIAGGKSRNGIGLKNLRDRLSLVYPGRHSFAISETSDSFSITMEIRT